MDNFTALLLYHSNKPRNPYFEKLEFLIGSAIDMSFEKNCDILVFAEDHSNVKKAVSVANSFELVVGINFNTVRLKNEKIIHFYSLDDAQKTGLFSLLPVFFTPEAVGRLLLEYIEKNKQ